MRFFQNILFDDLQLEIYEGLDENGWISPMFLSILNKKELISIFSIEPTPENELILEEIMSKIKKKTKLIDKEINNKQNWTISSGSSKLDSILDDNGICSGEITIFYGKFRTGKSQIAHQSCISLYNKFRANLPEFLTLFIDTENTFRPERIKQMAYAKNLPFKDVLKRIYLIHPKSFLELDFTFIKIEEIIEKYNIQYVILDSLTNFYRLEIGNHNQPYHSIIANLSSKLKKLKKIAKRNNIPVYVTSQVTATFNGLDYFNVQPILSKTLNSYSKQWILLSENEDLLYSTKQKGKRYAHLINGQKKKENIVQFRITNDGIINS